MLRPFTATFNLVIGYPYFLFKGIVRFRLDFTVTAVMNRKPYRVLPSLSFMADYKSQTYTSCTDNIIAMKQT